MDIYLQSSVIAITKMLVILVIHIVTIKAVAYSMQM